MKLRAATRGSPLALCQTQIVADELVAKLLGSEIPAPEMPGTEIPAPEIPARFGELEVEPVIIQTEGDKSEAPISEIGGKAVFAVALERALLEGKADIAVHSAKDLSARFPEELSIGAVLKRADARDVLVGVGAIEELPQGAVIGTGSMRRRIQLQAIRQDLEFVEVRGNIGTRLSKLQTQELDAIIVAKAALDRLQLKLTEFCILDTDLMIPQVGQGFLAVQYVKAQTEVAELLAGIDDVASHDLLDAERGFLKELEGDCDIPAAAHAQHSEEHARYLEQHARHSEHAKHSKTGGAIQIQGMLRTDNQTVHRLTLKSMENEAPSELGTRLTRSLLEMSSSK